MIVAAFTVLIFLLIGMAALREWGAIAKKSGRPVMTREIVAVVVLTALGLLVAVGQVLQLRLPNPTVLQTGILNAVSRLLRDGVTAAMEGIKSFF